MAGERKSGNAPNPDRVPHPLLSLSFLLSGVLLLLTDPFAWWRGLAAAAMLGLCIFGLYQWSLVRRAETGRRAEAARRAADGRNQAG